MATEKIQGYEFAINMDDGGMTRTLPGRGHPGAGRFRADRLPVPRNDFRKADGH